VNPAFRQSFIGRSMRSNRRVSGLDLGADDYSPNRFSPKELEARYFNDSWRRLAARPPIEPRDVPLVRAILRVGDLMVDTNRRPGDPVRRAQSAHLQPKSALPGRCCSAARPCGCPAAEILRASSGGYPTRRPPDLRVVEMSWWPAPAASSSNPITRTPELNPHRARTALILSGTG